MTDSMMPELETVKRALLQNQYDQVQCIDNSGKAVNTILELIPEKSLVGLGGSTSVRQLGILELLRNRGITVINDAESAEVPFEAILRRTLLCDVLLSSSNAVTLDGKLVNIDGVGNRVGAMAFGPKKVILVIGRNKVVASIESAMDRLRNVIAPYHAKAYGARLPCATTGYCVDCDSPARICRVTTIIEKKPSFANIFVLLVDDDLGLGWDPAWPEERKARIGQVYMETRKKYYPPGRKLRED